MEDELTRLRKKIDEIDGKIVEAVEERARIAKQIGEVKAGRGLAVFDPQREREVLEKITAESSLDSAFLKGLYGEIISYCRGDEKKIRRDARAKNASKTRSSAQVAVLGPAGTFTEQAAKAFFTKPALDYCDTVEDVFKLVEEGDMEYGVVAVENSLEGSVVKNLEALMEHDVYIVGELTLDINLCLMKNKGAGRIDVILSHPHALAQCSRFLKKNYPNAKQASAKSTSAAMKELSSYPDAAAIGFCSAAETYGLEVVAENIQDDFSQTRFILISRQKGFGPKTSIIFAVKDEPGALFKILEFFAAKNINLTKIESRPSRRKLGEYVFFMDFENNELSEEDVASALESIKPKTSYLKVLGSY